MKVLLRYLATGLATYIPGLAQFSRRGTGGTNSARYCYSVWLRHLVLAGSKGLNTNPKVVAELGPGDSLGMGLSALLCGSEKYYAFDVVEHANIKNNLLIFDELVDLFKRREDIPGEDELPIVKPYLDSYEFPVDILTEERMRMALNKSRIQAIRDALANPNEQNSILQYRVPWFDSSVLELDSVDFIYSQSVLECVDELSSAYKAMWDWLKPSGYMSHQIDFKSIGVAKEWNGHWAYSDLIWKIIRGKRPFLINREPHSTHMRLLESLGFQVVADKKIKMESEVSRDRLAPRFQNISDDDLTTSGALMLAVKPV